MQVYKMEGAFTESECKSLIAKYSDDAQPWRPSDRKKISTHVIEEDWYAKRLNSYIEKINGWMKFDITGLTDEPALVRYDEGSFFNWHHDLNSGRDGVNRKFSVITILSEPGSHDGGVLEFFDHGLMQIKEPKQGTLIAFPSWLQHRVTPITRGTRYSAVGFVGGPQFR